jgi:uncharacterized membrane protein YccC
MKFAVLPAFETFPTFCAAMGLFLVPVGFATAQSWQPAVLGMFGFNFVALLAPTNLMSYDTPQFYNTALGILAGCAVAPLAFRLLPPMSSALRARRLLALTLSDLRRLATAPLPPTLAKWEGRMYGRLVSLPDQAEPLQRAQMLAALSVGTQIIQLRHIAPGLGTSAELDTTLEAFAQGNSAIAVARLRELERRLARDADAEPEAVIVLRMRAFIRIISETLSEHRSYFDIGAAA